MLTRFLVVRRLKAANQVCVLVKNLDSEVTLPYHRTGTKVGQEIGQTVFPKKLGKCLGLVEVSRVALYLVNYHEVVLPDLVIAPPNDVSLLRRVNNLTTHVANELLERGKHSGSPC